MLNAALLDEAERVLRRQSATSFDPTVDGHDECIEFVRAVEDEQAWKAGYPFLEAFYAAHEARHPDIRLYAAARRAILRGERDAPAKPSTTGLRLAKPSQR
jgi:hypothetical protein